MAFNTIFAKYDKNKWEKAEERIADTIEETVHEFDDELNSIREQLKTIESISNAKENARTKTKDIIKMAKKNDGTVDYTDDIAFCHNLLRTKYNKYKRNPDAISPKLKTLSDARLLVMRAIVTEYLKYYPDDRVVKNVRNKVIRLISQRSSCRRRGRDISKL